MAKLIPYEGSKGRKLGFKRVRLDRPFEQKESQLNLFDQGTREHQIQRLRHLNPFEKGLQLDGKNDELARKLYLEAIETGVCVADAYCNLGILHARVGETAKAINSFTQALKHDARHLEAHYNLANMYYDAGNFSLAKIHYEVALELEESFPEVVYNLALTNISLGEIENAVKYLQQYMSQTDEDPDTKALLYLLRKKL